MLYYPAENDLQVADDLSQENDNKDSNEAQKSQTDSTNDINVHQNSIRIRSNTYTVSLKSEKQSKTQKIKTVLFRIGAILLIIVIIVGVSLVFLHMFDSKIFK